MTTDELGFVSFTPSNETFRGFLSIHTALEGDSDPEALALDAVAVYARLVREMRSAVAEIDSLRRSHTPVPARKVWQLGDLVFRLRGELAQLGLELDSVYRHLTRDLGVKTEWLEKVIILRRYIDDVSLIPECLNWGRIRDAPGRAARRISQGLPVE